MKRSSAIALSQVGPSIAAQAGAKPALRSQAKTYIRSARRLIEDGDVDGAERAVRSAVVALDKAAAKGAIHPNNASRRKSRLMSQLGRARNG